MAIIATTEVKPSNGAVFAIFIRATLTGLKKPQVDRIIKEAFRNSPSKALFWRCDAMLEDGDLRKMKVNADPEADPQGFANELACTFYWVHVHLLDVPTST